MGHRAWRKEPEVRGRKEKFLFGILKLSFGLPPFRRVPSFEIKNTKQSIFCTLISDLRPLTSQCLGA